MTPPALDRVVKRCLVKDPDDRWQSARDLEQELKWIADGGAQIGAAAFSGSAGAPAIKGRTLQLVTRRCAIGCCADGSRRLVSETESGGSAQGGLAIQHRAAREPAVSSCRELDFGNISRWQTNRLHGAAEQGR